MIRTIPFANALTIVFLAFHGLGGLLAAVSPGAYLSLIASWLFIDLSRLATGGLLMNLPSLAIGLLAAAVATWLAGAALALLHNALAGEREVQA